MELGDLSQEAHCKIITGQVHHICVFELLQACQHSDNKESKLSNSIIFFALFCSCDATSPCKRWLPINSFLI